MSRIIEPSKQVIELGKREVSFSNVSCLPPAIQALLSNHWEYASVLAWLIGHSEICRILYKNPADFEMLDIVYFGQSARGSAIDGIDGWLSHSLSGQALRDRLRVVSDLLASVLQAKKAVSGNFRLLDLGAGPGPYAFQAIQESKLSDLAFLHWDCVDIDRLALALGRDRAAQLQLSEVVSFTEGDFLSRDSYPQAEDQKANFGLMIGILCSMTTEQATACLKKVAPHFKPGAELLAATLLAKSFEEDPQTFRVLSNVLGWRLRPKTLSEVRGGCLKPLVTKSLTLPASEQAGMGNMPLSAPLFLYKEITDREQVTSCLSFFYFKGLDI